MQPQLSSRTQGPLPPQAGADRISYASVCKSQAEAPGEALCSEHPRHSCSSSRAGPSPSSQTHRGAWDTATPTKAQHEFRQRPHIPQPGSARNVEGAWIEMGKNQAAFKMYQGRSLGKQKVKKDNDLLGDQTRVFFCIDVAPHVQPGWETVCSQAARKFLAAETWWQSFNSLHL